MKHFKDAQDNLFGFDDDDTVPEGLTEITIEEAREIAAAKNPPPTPEQIVAGIAADVQAHMDAAARSMGYDDLKSAVTYADEPSVPRFQADGRALRAWRSLVWARCYELLAEVNAGIRGPMTSAEVIDLLPKLEAPAI